MKGELPVLVTKLKRAKKALVVHAHPSSDSYSAELCRRTVTGLEAAGYKVELLDLYAMDFVAAMTREEREAYHGDTPLVDPQAARSAKLIKKAQLVAFVYPTWWWGMPAVMKGWMEKTMVPGVGFELDENNKVQPGLKKLRRVVGVTTYGSSRLEMAAMNDAGRRIITRTLWLSSNMFRCRRTWLGLYNMDKIDDAARAEFANKVEAKMAEL